MHQKVTVDIPEKYEEGYKQGELDISKVVVRDKENGKILEHIDLNINENESEDNHSSNGKIVEEVFKGIVISAITARMYKIMPIFKTEKRKENIEMSRGTRTKYRV